MTRDQELILLRIEKRIAEKRAAKARATSDPLETLAAIKYPHLDRADRLKAVKLELEIETANLRKSKPKAMSNDYPPHLQTKASDEENLAEVIDALKNIIADPTRSEKEKARAKRALAALNEEELAEKTEARARGQAVAMNVGTAQKFYVPRSQADALMDDFRRKYYGVGR